MAASDLKVPFCRAAAFVTAQRSRRQPRRKRILSEDEEEDVVATRWCGEGESEETGAIPPHLGILGPFLYLLSLLPPASSF